MLLLSPTLRGALLVGALGSPLCSVAQSAPLPRGTAPLSGTVVDASTRQPVEFATVALLPAAGEQPLAATAADARGRFVFKNLAPGTYRLSISLVGYAARTLPVTVAAEGTVLPAVELAAAPEQLAGVTVTGERDLVENKPDRLVYNAERDATNAGGTATDVLRKTPLLNVDADGNVQLRGSANLRVLLNNKPSALLAGNLAEALKQIPADQIKAVEVLTAPSARYDGEGSAGVVNIVLKKGSLPGVSGNAGGSVGNRGQNANASLSVRRGKLGASGGLSLFNNRYPSRSTLTRTDYLGGGQPGQLAQRSAAVSTGRGSFGQLELSYDPSAEHGFTLSVNQNGYRSHFPQELFNQYTGGGPQRDTLYTRDNDQRFRRRSYDVSGGYTRTFAQHAGREWSVLGQYSRARNTQRYALAQYPTADQRQGPVEYRERSQNAALNAETTLQTDYVHPLRGQHAVEAGAKAILRQVTSDYTIDTLLVSRQSDFAPSPYRSNAFEYRQHVGAGYGTYQFKAGQKYSFSLGARLEYTAIAGRFQTEAGRFANHYTNLLPSLSATRHLKQPGQTLRLSYARRIQRPDIYYLNPYVRQLDPRNISYGNPELAPETTDNYELGYSTFGQTSSLNATAFVRRTGNAIESISFYSEERARTETTYRNIAANTSYGLSLYGSVRPQPQWQIGGNADISYVRLRSPALSRTAARTSLNGNLNASLRFGKQYTAQAYGGFWTGGVGLQTRYSGGAYYAASLKRTFLREKLDVTLNASNFLQPYRRFATRTSTAQFETRSTYYNYQRTVRLAVSYRFGHLADGAQRQRRSIRNDDRKAGGDGGAQGT